MSVTCSGQIPVFTAFALTGKDLRNVLNEAAILSVQSGKDRITEETVMAAFGRFTAGPERKVPPPGWGGGGNEY